MSISIGNLTIDSITLGNTMVDKIYLGSVLVYEAGGQYQYTQDGSVLTINNAPYTQNQGEVIIQ